MSKRCREEPCPICAHFHDYEGGVPCSTCGHVYSKAEGASQKASKFPSEIIPGRVFLGSFDNASRVELLKALGITHVLNCVHSCQPLYKNSFIYHTVSSNPPDYEECYQFLDTLLQAKQENRVLIHCMTGSSRSPAVAVAFLMKFRGWRLMESFKWVKDRRPAINLAAGDVDRLQVAELQIHGSSSVGYQQSSANAGHTPGPFAWSWKDTPAAAHQPASLPSIPLNLNFAPQPNRGTSFAFGSPPTAHQAAMES